MTLSEKLNRISPKLCRLIARKKNGFAPMTNTEIAAKAGIARSTVAQLSRMDRWDNVTLGTIEAYTGACGINLLQPWRQADFLRRRSLTYMDNASPGQKRMLDRLIKDLRATANNGVH